MIATGGAARSDAGEVPARTICRRPKRAAAESEFDRRRCSGAVDARLWCSKTQVLQSFLPPDSTDCLPEKVLLQKLTGRHLLRSQAGRAAVLEQLHPLAPAGSPLEASYNGSADRSMLLAALRESRTVWQRL